MYKMIVMDLDGTLLNEQGKTTIETQEYLQILKEKGYVIVIATGRMYASILNATSGAKFANYIISDTGSYIYNTEKKEPIMKKDLTEDFARKILLSYKDNCQYIDICDKNTIFKYTESTVSSDIIKSTKDIEYILKNCSHISHIALTMKTEKDTLEAYNNLLTNEKGINIILMQDSFSNRKWLDIMPANCTKYSGIQYLSKMLNIENEDIIAFGDGVNDSEMLKNCGYGVAMINALPEVKRVADDITKKDNNYDGVIDYLKNIINLG